MERLPEPSKKVNFGIKCMKYILILINVLYLIISFLMISGATTLKIIFGEYYFVLWRNSTVDSLSSLWISIGCFMLVFSIFGIIAAVKESALMTNVYGLFLSLIFILQMASAITGFTLMIHSNDLARNTLDQLLRYVWYEESSYTINWVQTTFECCGNDGPLDWRYHGKYTPAPPTEPAPWWYTSDGSTTEVPSTTTEKELGIQLPQSCCIQGSNYNHTKMICDSYFTQGCRGPLQAIVYESGMMFGISAILIGLVQILGVVCSFVFARTIRRNKTDRDIQKWANHRSMSSDRPAYADQVTTQEIREDESTRHNNLNNYNY